MYVCYNHNNTYSLRSICIRFELYLSGENRHKIIKDTTEFLLRKSSSRNILPNISDDCNIPNYECGEKSSLNQDSLRYDL